MQNQPSTDPRDQALRAALNDIAAICTMLDDEFVASYRGSERAEYLRVLGSFVDDFGGTLEASPPEIVAVFGERRIKLRFG